MKYCTVELNKEYFFIEGGQLSYLVMDYPYDGDGENAWRRPAVIVVPGGGYGCVSKREGEPIAAAFLAKGFQTFILGYLCAPDGVRYPEQLMELSAAVDYVKKHADELHVNPNEIFVVGFSAGGHLAANLAVEHQNVSQKVGVALDCKPTAIGLGYPVISSTHGHFGSYDNLLNGYTEEAKQELLKTLNLNEAVSEHTPPAFIWTTAEDAVVPPDNAMRYALALDKLQIPYELHVYPHGIHGLSTGNQLVNPDTPALKKVNRWIADCADFFYEFVEEPF